MFFKNSYTKRLLLDQIVEEYWEMQKAKTPELVDQISTKHEKTKLIKKIPYIGPKSVEFRKRITKTCKV